VVSRETTAQMVGNFLSGACAIILHLDDCTRCGATVLKQSIRQAV